MKEYVRVARPYLGVALAFVMFALLAGCGGEAGTTTTPRLFGLTQNEAREMLEEKGLDLGEVTYQPGYQLYVEQGTVVGQTPSSGAALRKGTEVGVFLAGANALRTPDVVGKTANEALEILQSVGLKVGKVSTVSGGEVEAGRVVAQQPQAQLGVPVGAQVDLEIAQGVVVAEVPDVVGKPRAEAEEALKAAGFAVGVLEVFDEGPAGSVVDQAPTGGSSLNAGAKVSLAVSKGPVPVAEVPSVVSQSQAAATKALGEAGFTVKVNQAYSGSVANGTVAAQTPPGGVFAAKGAAVEITVSRGPAPPNSITIPNVSGRPQQDAARILTDAGLKVEVFEAYSETVPAGYVMGQAPSPGLQTPPGATIGIAVSQGPVAPPEAPPAEPEEPAEPDTTTST